MTQKLSINAQINKVCTNKTLTCLHAIESGSRAWGFSSPDSDFDVRLIYQQDPDCYLRLMSGKDTFEHIDDHLFDVPFDIGGWDIRKALILIYKSNAVIFEWLNSPIIYQSKQEFTTLITATQTEFFNPKAVFYHYRGMANNANNTLEFSQPIKLKKWFYLLRALLASIWTLTNRTPPPVLMNQMFDLLTAKEQHEVAELIAIKQTINESQLHLLSLGQQQISTRLWQLGSDLEDKEQKKDIKGDIRLLDEIFRSTVFK